MNLEWFSRMESGIKASLSDVCTNFGEYDVMFETDTTLRHPAFIFYLYEEEEPEDFCIIHFDPNNQELYSYYYDEDVELQAKVLLEDLDELLQFVHASFHDYLETFDDLEEVLDDSEEDLEDEDDELDLATGEAAEDVDEEYDIEWITNDKHIHIEENHGDLSIESSIYYKLGVDRETGDGVILRNTISSIDGEEEEEEQVILFFKEDEASYLADLVNEYMTRQ